MIVGFFKQPVVYLSLVVSVLIATVAIFSSSSPSAFAATVTADITPGSSSMTTDAYAPNPIEINVGDTVTWTNKDSTPHTVTSGTAGEPDGEFDSSPGFNPLMAAQQTFSHTFEDAGEFPYYCGLHVNMVGTVIVADSEPSNSTNTSSNNSTNTSSNNSTNTSSNNSTNTSSNNSTSTSANGTSFFDSEFEDGFVRPTSMAFSPDGRLFVNEQGGHVRVIKNGVLLDEPFLTISVNSGTERGLVGIAFDPNFESNGYVYVYYTTSSDPIHNRVSRFTADAANPDIAAANSETILLDLERLGESMHHNGGSLNFGADGKLYIGVGYNTNDTNPQSLGTRLGKILRINPDGSIPSDNPFVNSNTTGAKGEIWALGLRNPFSGAMKPGTNTLYINDVGLRSWEEINLIEKGGNYGWPECEGSCPNPDFINPIYPIEQPGEIRRAIAGGTFYEGTQFPEELRDGYFFGDFVGNHIRVLTPDNDGEDFLSDTSTPVDVDVGPDGSLYYLSFLEGAVHIVTYASEPSTEPPEEEPPNEPPTQPPQEEPPVLPPGEPSDPPSQPPNQPPSEPPTSGGSGNTVDARLDGKTYTVVVQSTAVKVTGATIDAGQSVTIFLNGSGQVTLKLQKTMIDGITSVMAGSQAVPFTTVASNASDVTIEFSVPTGVNSVEIIAATVVPEFGTVIAVVVLATMIVAVIGIARFSGRSLGFKI